MVDYSQLALVPPLRISWHCVALLPRATLLAHPHMGLPLEPLLVGPLHSLHARPHRVAHGFFRTIWN